MEKLKVERNGSIANIIEEYRTDFVLKQTKSTK